MLEALANKADPNWISTENEDKTPIMKALETVSIYSGYKKVSAQAHNLRVMLGALANKADPNWISMENEDKTPIMKAIETVSIYSGV